MNDWKEAPIQISGTALSPAQSMALRVACTSFLTEMQDEDALGTDEHGRRMVKAYRERLREVLALIRKGCHQ